MRVLIIGAGEMGKALGAVLGEKQGIIVNLWDKDSAKITNQKSLSETVPEADFIFLCVPSWCIREALQSLLLSLSKKSTIISFAKGVEAESMQTMDEVCAGVLPEGQRWAICGGPMIAEELASGQATPNGGQAARGVIASKDKNIFSAVAELFSGTSIQLEYSDDIRGVAWAGVLKNIYAIALGISDGLGWGRNQKGWLVTASLREMLEIIRIFRGKKETALGLAGLGDLVATGFSNYSSNRRVGEMLAKGKRENLRSEGLSAIGAINKLFSGDISHYRILHSLREIVSGGEAGKIFSEMIQ